VGRFLALDDTLFDRWANASIANAKRHSTRVGSSAVSWEPDPDVVLKLNAFVHEHGGKIGRQLASHGGFLGC